MGRTALFSIILVAAIVAFSSTALAANHDQQIRVHFDELAVAYESDELLVDYVISRADFQRLQHLDVTPYLEVRIPDGAGGALVSRELMLTIREGRFSVDTPFSVRRADQVRVVPVRHYELDCGSTFELTGDFASTYQFPLTSGFARFDGSNHRYVDTDHRSDRDRHQRRDRSDRRSGRRGTRNRDRRRDRNRSRHSRAEVIEACQEQGTFSRDRDHCVEATAGLRARNPVHVVEACGEAATFSSNFRSCLDHAVNLPRRDAAETIEACGEATSFGSQLDGCLESASNLDRDAAGIVRACAASNSFASQVTSCIDRS